jgi:serine/threonine protein kinase
MQTCLSCGFDRVEEGARCGACGEDPAGGATMSLEDEATVLASPDRRTPPPSQLAPGHLFAGRYRVESLLGRGGMGTVYRVVDDAGTPLALKVLHSAASADGSLTDRFRRETRLLERVGHPAVPKIYASGIEGDQMYFVGELVDGSDLRTLLGKRGTFKTEEIARIAGTVADALHAAHQQGVVHRDVKPHNIMVASDGRVRLLDFGIARGVGLDMKTITATGMIVGTPEYMSPEQFQALRVGPRSDIYSLGVVMFELATGVLPFQADTPVALAIKLQTEVPPRPRSIRSDVPAWMERIILRCLEKDPVKRFGTAEELAVELRRPHVGSRRVQRLANEDYVVEDDSGSTDWAFMLTSKREKKDWSLGMALRYGERYYRLDDCEKRGDQWEYRFAPWPEESILRKVVDYDEAIAADVEKRERSLGRKIRKLFSS